MKKYLACGATFADIYPIVIASLFVCPPATAQVVRQAAEAETTPYVRRGADGIQECGIQVKVVDDRPPHVDQYTLVLAVSPEDNFGVIQGGRLRLGLNQWKSILAGKISIPKPSGPSPAGFWITGEADAKPLVPIRLVQDKNIPAKLIAVAAYERTVSLMSEIAKGAPTQFNLRYPGDVSAVMRFSAALDKEGMATMVACFDGYRKRLDERSVQIKAEIDRLPGSVPRNAGH